MVIPRGEFQLGTTWKRWLFKSVHVGPFAGHRSTDATTRMLGRIAYWATMQQDVKEWVEKCQACAIHRRRVSKIPASITVIGPYSPWQSVMIDVDGPSRPTDTEGNCYVLTYKCCVSYEIFLIPLKKLEASHFRSAVALCVWRSRTIPLCTTEGPPAPLQPRTSPIAVGCKTNISGIINILGTCSAHFSYSSCHEQNHLLDLQHLRCTCTRSFR